MKSTVPGGVAAAALATIGGLHILWVADPWPWETSAELRAAVFGSADTDVPKPAYILMGGALAASATLVLSQSGLIRRIGPAKLRSAAMYALSGGLFLRGAGGFFLNSGASEEFRTLNTFVYSPLCLGLAALTLVVLRSSEKDTRTVGSPPTAV